MNARLKRMMPLNSFRMPKNWRCVWMKGDFMLLSPAARIHKYSIGGFPTKIQKNGCSNIINQSCFDCYIK